MKISEIANCLEAFAPLKFQESYDNAGLITGNPGTEVKGALLTIDITEKVIEEAIEKGLNLIISHHPIVFGGLKKITGRNYVERCIIMVIKNDIAIYAAHTNIDNAKDGVNYKILQKLGVQQPKALIPMQNALSKLVVFVPVSHENSVRSAIFEAGAGVIGEYDCCSFNLKGKGSFRGNDKTNPYIGQQGKLHFEEEVRVETILPNCLQSRVVAAMIKAHPYEEVAYDLYALSNDYPGVGAGAIGELDAPIDALGFLQLLKTTFHVPCIKHTDLIGKPIKKVAVCGGSGSGFLNAAIGAGADIFVSADFKYHQFFDAESKILIADIGHFESEQFTKEIFYDLLTKKFPTFVPVFSEVNTNPINYF